MGRRKGRGKGGRKIDEDGNKNKIVVQAKSELDSGLPLEDSHAEFYIVELDKGEVIKCSHRLRKEVGFSSMVALGSRVYLIGGFEDDEKEGGQDGEHGGTSYLDLSNEAEGWKAAPPLKWLNCGRIVTPCCVAFRGNIYTFRGTVGHYYHPPQKRWFKMAPPPGAYSNNTIPKFCFSRPLLTDPPNNRLLLYYESLNRLYAYYPAGNRWEVVAQPFLVNFRWTYKVVYHCGLLLFYEPSPSHLPDSEYNVISAAFDVSRKLWLDVRLASPFMPRVRQYPFRAFLNLGNGILCLATHSPSGIYPFRNCLFTVLFRVDLASQHLLVTPLSAKHHTFPDHAFYFCNYVAI